MGLNRYIVTIAFYVDADHEDSAERTANKLADAVYRLHDIDSDIVKVEERD